MMVNMKILPTYYLRTRSPVSSLSTKMYPASRLQPEHSPASTQVAANLMKKPSIQATSDRSMHNVTAFQPQTASVSSSPLLSSELELLAIAKTETQQHLKEAQAELAALMVKSNAPPPSGIEVNKCFLHALHQEKQAILETGLGRIYQTVLNEEVEVQGKQTYASLHQSVHNELNSVEKDFTEKFNKINAEKYEHTENIEKSSLSGHDKDIAKDHIHKEYREKIDILFKEKEKKESKCWSNYYAISKGLNSSKNNDVYDRISTINSSPAEIKSGEIMFLKHKLAIIDYCQKTSSLYEQSIWSPSEKITNLLAKRKKNDSENINNLTIDELIKLSQTLSAVKSAKITLFKVKTIKRLYKYSLVGTPTYVLDRMTSNKFKSSLKTAQEEFKNCKNSLQELPPNKKQSRKAVNQMLIEKLLSQERKSDLCDEKIDSQISLLNELPLLSSIRGVDPTSGLYHEKQFSKSGTCILHSVNHYIAGYANQNDDVFLAFTPKRLELMLNAVYHKQQAELFENLSAALLSGIENKYFSDIFKDQEKGLRALNRKYVLHNANYAADYNYEKQESKITEAVSTSDFNNQGIIAILMSKVYGLNEDVSSSHSAITWKMKQGTLEKLQNTHNQLRMHYHPIGREFGHAMSFSKAKNGKWYFQDSHFDAPVPCTPIDMINHLNGQDKADSPLSNINYRGSKVSFREHHDIGATTKISFFHYS
jgi:hypothetical protein